MKIEGKHQFTAVPEVVWPMLQDPAILRHVLPGCENLTQISENEYEGTLYMRVGKVDGTFDGVVKLQNVQPPHSYQLQATGRCQTGIVRGTGQLHLAGSPDGTTTMTYSGDVAAAGEIASVGQRLLATSARALIRQSLERLDQLVAARTQIHTTSVEAAAATAVPASANVTRTHPHTLLQAKTASPHQGALLQTAAAAALALLTLWLLENWLTSRIARKTARILRDSSR